jgi:hypothetical protein
MKKVFFRKGEKKMKSKGIKVFVISGALLFGGYFATKEFLIDIPNIKAAEEENINISKEQIHEKMLNSVDYFDNVKGEFTYYKKKNGVTYTVEYQIKLGNNPKSYEKVLGAGVDEELVFDSDLATVQQIFNKDKTVQESKIDKDEFNAKLKLNKEKSKSPKTRYGTLDGQKLYKYRSDPTMTGYAKNSIFPQEIALGFLEDYDTWEIKGKTSYLGLKALIIEGTFNDYYSNKHNAESFKLWIHEDTGILLKYEEYDANGEVVIYQKTDDIKINNTIDEQKFKLKSVDKQKFKKVE